jgi:hypothetical protein
VPFEADASDCRARNTLVKIVVGTVKSGKTPGGVHSPWKNVNPRPRSQTANTAEIWRANCGNWRTSFVLRVRGRSYLILLCALSDAQMISTHEAHLAALTTLLSRSPLYPRVGADAPTEQPLFAVRRVGETGQATRKIAGRLGFPKMNSLARKITGAPRGHGRLQTYKCGCHCGRVRFRVRVDPEQSTWANATVRSAPRRASFISA